MRIVIQAAVEGAEAVQIGVVERAADAAPSSGLGLLLAESRELLAALQAVVIAEQTKEVIKAMSRCASCLAPLAVKDTKGIVLVHPRLQEARHGKNLTHHLEFTAWLLKAAEQGHAGA